MQVPYITIRSTLRGPVRVSTVKYPTWGYYGFARKFTFTGTRAFTEKVLAEQTVPGLSLYVQSCSQLTRFLIISFH